MVQQSGARWLRRLDLESDLYGFEGYLLPKSVKNVLSVVDIHKGRRVAGCCMVGLVNSCRGEVCKSSGDRDLG